MGQEILAIQVPRRGQAHAAISLAEMAADDKIPSTIKFVVTNSATFSDVARAQIKSETATYIARRRSDVRQRAPVSTLIPFPSLQPASGHRDVARRASSSFQPANSERSQLEPSSASVKQMVLAVAKPNRADSDEILEASRSHIHSQLTHVDASTTISGSLFDSMENPTLHVDQDARELLYLYRDQVVPYRTTMRQMVGSIADWAFPRAFHDEAIFNSTLCDAATLVPGWTNGLHNSNAAYDPAVGQLHEPTSVPPLILYKSKTIKLLRQKLSKNNIEDSSAHIRYIVLQLLCCELQHGTLEAIRAHIDGLQRLLQHTNVTTAALLFILVPALTVLCLGAAVAEILPPFPLIIPDTVISADTWTLLTDTSNPKLLKAATALAGLTITGLLGRQLMGLVQRRRLCFVVRELATERKIDTKHSCEYAYFYSSNRLIDHDLLDLLFNHAPTLTPLQKCVAQALFFVGYLNGVSRFEAGFMYTRILCQRYYDTFTLDGRNVLNV